VVAALGAMLFLQKRTIDKEKLFSWLLPGVPCVCYALLVARISVYTADRYVQPIYPIVLIAGMGLVLVCLEAFIKSKKLSLAISCLLICVVSANGLRICPWEYLYRESGRLLKTLEAYAGQDCIFIYDKDDPYARVQQSYFEVRQYRSVVFVADTDLELLGDLGLEGSDSLIVCIDYACDAESVLDAVMRADRRLSRRTELGKAGLYSTTWYLER